MKLTKKQVELRKHFENDLFAFAKYVNPNYVYGDIHETVFRWLSDSKSGTISEDDLNDLLLLPRAHLKSHCIATWCVWMITKQPWTSIVYTSANEDLAKVQVYAIKGMLQSDNYRKLWPEMTHPEEGKRDLWTNWAINVDHPMRKKMGTRDFTIVVKTIKSTNAGLHCDILVFDDVVTDQNAYTEVGRQEVRIGVSSFIGVKNPGAITKAVGTRYHPRDIYDNFINAKEPILDDEGEIIGERDLWRVAQAVTEDSGFGNGNFLWPRTRSAVTGLWYGFNANVLAKKKAEYISMGRVAQFWAQYYNEPNDPGNDRVKTEFEYFNPKLLQRKGFKWYYDGKLLNIFAGMDIAFTDDTGSSRADYSALAVIGVDCEGFIYILHVSQYRTEDYNVHYNNIINLYDKYRWKKIKIETNNGGKLVEREIRKELRRNGRTMRIIGKAKTKHDGAKLERYELILEPRYTSGYVLHYKGGDMTEYEEQVRKTRPKHDDMKDAVTTALEEIELPPQGMVGSNINNVTQVVVADSKYGGRRLRRA